jgi:hypothetical protein
MTQSVAGVPGAGCMLRTRATVSGGRIWKAASSVAARLRASRPYTRTT